MENKETQYMYLNVLGKRNQQQREKYLNQKREVFDQKGIKLLILSAQQINITKYLIRNKILKKRCSEISKMNQREFTTIQLTTNYFKPTGYALPYKQTRKALYINIYQLHRMKSVLIHFSNNSHQMITSFPKTLKVQGLS